jgi:hypothetical protein
MSYNDYTGYSRRNIRNEPAEPLGLNGEPSDSAKCGYNLERETRLTDNSVPHRPCLPAESFCILDNMRPEDVISSLSRWESPFDHRVGQPSSHIGCGCPLEVKRVFEPYTGGEDQVGRVVVDATILRLNPEERDALTEEIRSLPDSAGHGGLAHYEDIGVIKFGRPGDYLRAIVAASMQLGAMPVRGGVQEPLFDMPNKQPPSRWDSSVLPEFPD